MPALRWPDSWVPLVHLATLALIFAILSRGQAVLVPLALAGLLAFVLTPPVRGLERIGVKRALAVAFSLTLTLAAIGGFGYLLSRQVGELAASMPTYSDAIRVKLAALRQTHGSLASIQEAVDKVSAELDRDRARQAAREPGGSATNRPALSSHVQPVTVIPSEPTDLERLRAVVEPIFEPIATAVIVLVLTAFLLVRREDVRNRFIRLIGQGRMTVTTRTIDEAGQRISRYLLTQTLINAAFGAVVTAGLFAIGVVRRALGRCAGLLRFVPYIGALLSMVMPIALAFVQFEGWGPTFATLGLFLGADLLTAQVVEPLVVGHRTGVSALALLVMALLWTWLWGPIGLLLSTPITVCLAVLGTHIPKLEFLAVLLGDAPALETRVTFYQRLLARDDDEASEIATTELESSPLETVIDEVILPALVWATADRQREEISDTEQRFILDATRSIAEDALDRLGTDMPASDTRLGRARVVAVPGRSAADGMLVDGGHHKH